MSEYAENLKREKEKNDSQTAVENILSFYSSNKEICDNAYDFYIQYINDINKYVAPPQNVYKETFCRYLLEDKVLVITANPIEEAVFLRWLHREVEKEEKRPIRLQTYLVDKTSFVIGNLLGKTIIHIHAKDTGEEYTRIAINNATKIFSPSSIFMLGICYGLEMKKYQIGSVFVSDSITTFRLNIRDNEKSNKTIYQAQDEYVQEPDEDFVEPIRSSLRFTQVFSILSDDEKPTVAKTEVGKLLSSNFLMSSKRVKDAVMKQYAKRKPHPLGGEMEGAGILKSYYVQEDKFHKWMIIKSICDWGEKKNALSENEKENDRLKDSIQAFAMTNTCGAFEAILNTLVKQEAEHE